MKFYKKKWFIILCVVIALFIIGSLMSRNSDDDLEGSGASPSPSPTTQATVTPTDAPTVSPTTEPTASPTAEPTQDITTTTGPTEEITPSPKPMQTIAPTNTTAPKEIIDYKITDTQDRVYVSSFGKTMWETLIEIENTGNVPLYLGTTKYDLEDKDGKLLKTGSLSSFPSIINPGEKAYFYGNDELTNASGDISVIFLPRWDIKKSKEERINFDITDIEIKEGQFGTTVFGRISNNTGKKQTWAIISVILYKEDGSPIGVWMINIMEDMENGAKLGFEIPNIMTRTIYDNVSSDMVDHYKAYAYPPQMQF